MVRYFLTDYNKYKNKNKQNPQALKTELICSKIRACTLISSLDGKKL